MVRLRRGEGDGAGRADRSLPGGIEPAQGQPPGAAADLLQPHGRMRPLGAGDEERRSVRRPARQVDVVVEVGRGDRRRLARSRTPHRPPTPSPFGRPAGRHRPPACGPAKPTDAPASPRPLARGFTSPVATSAMARRALSLSPVRGEAAPDEDHAPPVRGPGQLRRGPGRRQRPRQRPVALGQALGIAAGGARPSTGARIETGRARDSRCRRPRRRPRTSPRPCVRAPRPPRRRLRPAPSGRQANRVTPVFEWVSWIGSPPFSGRT